MISLWIGIALLTAATLAFALWPLFRRAAGTSALDHALAHYAARKTELERQFAAGLISATEKDAAEAEQARQLLALERKETPDRPVDGRGSRRIAALAMLVLVPALSLALYARIGSPGAPDRPLAERAREPRPLDIADALRRIEAHLQKNPDDLRGYEVVAPVYLSAGRFADAAEAYRQMIRLAGETAERLAAMGESLVAAEDGIVGEAARAAFSRAVQLQPGFEKARFYLALALEQDGDTAGARRRLTELADGLPEGPQRLRIVAELERMGAAGSAASGQPPGAGPAIAALPAEARDAAIRAMVEGLASRLSQSGGSSEEWLRLIRARMVLGERSQAIADLGLARKALSADPGALAALAALASGLGLEPTGKAP